ncbi:MAG: hypothetical protein ACTSUE_06480 [Promethearchaeota archaeon]
MDNEYPTTKKKVTKKFCCYYYCVKFVAMRKLSKGGKVKKEEENWNGEGEYKVSKDDCDTLFALMDLNNAQLGHIEKVRDPNIRAICIEQNPSLASSFSSVHRAEEEHKRRLRMQGFGKQAKVVRSLTHNTQEDKSLILFQRRVHEKGYTKEEVFHIFEEVNRWLPSRYDYIMAKAEGHLDASTNPFTSTKMHLNAEIALGTGQLRGELFDQDSDDDDVDEFHQGSKKNGHRGPRVVDEVEHIRQMANEWKKQKKKMERGNYDEYVFGDEEEELEDGEEMTIEQAKALYVESRVMVDVTALCRKTCSIDSINDVFSLYGCKDHGLIHICLANDECIHQAKNRDKDIVCVFSGIAVNKIYRGPRTYSSRGRNCVRCAAGGAMGIERKRREHSVIQKEYMAALSSFSENSGKVESNKRNGDSDSDNDSDGGGDNNGGGGGSDEIEAIFKNGKPSVAVVPSRNRLVEFVHIEDKEFNVAMVESAIRSGEGCVVTSLAAAILSEKLFYQKKQDNSRGSPTTLDEEARKMAMSTSTRGLLEADRGSFLDDAGMTSTMRGGFARRTPFSVRGGQTPFTPGIAAAAAEGAFISPESRRDGIGPSVIPSEDFVITGDTFVTQDVLREISAEGTGGTFNTSPISNGTGSDNGGSGNDFGISGAKQNALFSSSHTVMSTSPRTRGTLRRCASSATGFSSRSSPGTSPLICSNSPRSMGRLDKETRYEINPYRGVQKRLRTWGKIMRTGDHPSNIVTTPRYAGNRSAMAPSPYSSMMGGRVFTPKTPLAMSREVKEQEAILQSQAGVVMKRRKRGRNSLVRSTSEVAGLNESELSPFSDSFNATSITRGSRPGRSKKNEELYQKGMFQVYMPPSLKGGKTNLGNVKGGKDSTTRRSSPMSPLHRPSPIELIPLGKSHRASASPLLRKVLTSSKANGSMLSPTRDSTKVNGRPVEFHKDQYFLVKGEKQRAKNTNLKAIAMLNRSKQLKKLKEEQNKQTRDPLVNGKQRIYDSDFINDSSTLSSPNGRSSQHPVEKKIKPSKVTTEATDTVLMGSIADILIGRPSIPSIHRIMHSSNTISINSGISTAAMKGEKGDTHSKECDSIEHSNSSESSDLFLSEEYPENNDTSFERSRSFLQTPRHQNILQSKRLVDRKKVRAKKKKRKHDEKANTGGVSLEQENVTDTIAFRGKMERFLRWVDQKTLVFANDMDQYKNSIRTVMKDLIFSSNKRHSMKVAYRIVSLIGAKDIVKTRSCRASRVLKQQIVLDQESPILKLSSQDLNGMQCGVQDGRDDDGMEKRKTKKDKASMTTTTSSMTTTTTPKTTTTVTTTTTTRMFQKPLDHSTVMIDNRKRKREAEQRTVAKSISKYRLRLTLGAIDDTFGRQLLRHGIQVIPTNEEKLRRYFNEIYYLWRLLMTSSYAGSLSNPKAQFDHFVLGVMYYLTEKDIVLCDTVVMARDPWLKESLPKRKRLCENYASKLKKSEVARIIQRHTSLRMDMLTFSTPSRVYNTKFITHGITRVKNLVFHFNQEMVSHQILISQKGLDVTNGARKKGRVNRKGTSIYEHIDGTLIGHYISRNSSRTFIQVGKTSGNVRRAARQYKRRKRLFS